MISVSRELNKALQAELRRVYQQGWDDAMRALVSAAKEVHRTPPTELQQETTISARDAVVRAMQSLPAGVKSMQIFRWIKAQGWAISFDAVRAAVKRLKKSGEVVSEGQGYSL